MWPGKPSFPGKFEWGSKKYINISHHSLDQKSKKNNLDYVDIFYSHTFDPKTPLEETADALHLQSIKVLTDFNSYVGISSYSSKQTDIKMYKLFFLNSEIEI